MIEDGDSIYGKRLGDYILHTAARGMCTDTVALLFDQPAFDSFLLRSNDNIELPSDVVGVPHTRLGGAMSSVLSVTRINRAACILWSFETLRRDSPHLLVGSIPPDIVKEILTPGVLPSPAPGSLDTDVMTLFRSPSVWPRPCLALAPPTATPQLRKRSHSSAGEEEPASKRRRKEEEQ